MGKINYCPQCGTKLEMKNCDNRERLSCPGDSCGYVFWDNPLPVVAAIIEYKGNVLLARNRAWPPKVFGLVTGFLEKGETPDAAVAREVKEEVGLDSSKTEFFGLYSFFEQNQLLIVYHVSASGELSLGEELAEIKLIPAEKVRPWPFGTGIAVRDWLEKKTTGPKA